MTDANANGPAETQTTAPAANAASAPVQAAAVETTWVAGLQDEENRAFVEKKQWKSIDDALKSQRELEKLLGNSVRLPGEKATAEEIAAFRAKMGVPEKPEGYELKLDPATVPEDFPYDEKAAGEFKTWAHDVGLNPKQAQEMHDKFVATQAKNFLAAKDELAKQVAAQETAAHEALVASWGDPKSETYKANVGYLTRTLTPILAEYPSLKPLFDQTGILSPDGAIKNAEFAKAFLPLAIMQNKEASATPGTSNASPKEDAASILYGS